MSYDHEFTFKVSEEDYQQKYHDALQIEGAAGFAGWIDDEGQAHIRVEASKQLIEEVAEKIDATQEERDQVQALGS